MTYHNKGGCRQSILDEIGGWPVWARIAIGLLVLPVVAYYVSTTPVALVWGKVGEYTAKTDIVLMASVAAAGNLAKLMWPRSWLPFVVPPVVLALIIGWIWALAGPLTDFIQLLPFLFQIIGTPVLSVWMFARYQRWVGLRPA